MIYKSEKSRIDDVVWVAAMTIYDMCSSDLKSTEAETFFSGASYNRIIKRGLNNAFNSH
ncbi:hypothetical protein JCM19233_5331 [Vibrio astriarenae]|nr:hypothetical protein JCM19233_5331 [Vibrio sp. C7]